MSTELVKIEEPRKIKLNFAPTQTSPTLEIGNGDYDRKFTAADQPFEVDEEEARMLLNTRHFVEVEQQTADSADHLTQQQGGENNQESGEAQQ